MPSFRCSTGDLRRARVFLRSSGMFLVMVQFMKMSPVNVLQLVLQVLCNCKRVAVLVAAADAWSSEDCRLAVCSVWHEHVEASQNAKSDPKLKQINATVALSAANAENSHSTAAAAVATSNTPPVSWASDVVAVQTGTHEVWQSASCSFATQYVLLDIVALFCPF